MRYYGKEGNQCQLSMCEDSGGALYSCKKAAHAVLFGRVPKGVVIWLGLGLMLLSVTLGLWGLSALTNDSDRYTRDHGSAVMIRR